MSSTFKISLRDKALNDSLKTQGFVKFPLLPKAIVDDLRTLYEQLHPGEFEGFMCSMYSTDYEYRRKVNDELLRILGDSIDSVFINSEILFANFLSKSVGDKGNFPVHQDWTFVDENVADSYAIWIPLVDVNENTGALWMIPKSHEIGNKVRGPGIPDPYSNIHQVIMDRFGVSVPLKAGEAIVWNHRMIHYSLPNEGNQERPVVTLITIPTNCQALHHIGFENQDGDDSKAEQYLVDSDFFLQYEVGVRPSNLNPTLVDCSFSEVKEDELAKLTKTGKNKERLSVWEWITSLV